MNYISSADTSKLVRKTLKENFPGIKFSVTSKNSIRVSWVDGPMISEVEKVAGHFHSSDFDGMQDLETSNGQPYLNSYIFFNRSYTKATIEAAAGKFSEKYGANIELPEIKESNGIAWMENYGGSVGGGEWSPYWNARNTINRILEGKDN